MAGFGEYSGYNGYTRNPYHDPYYEPANSQFKYIYEPQPRGPTDFPTQNQTLVLEDNPEDGE